MKKEIWDEDIHPVGIDTMKNGNAEVIREMKSIIQDGKNISPTVRDRLLFTAVIDIYETLEEFRPVQIFYQVGIYLASALGISMIAFIGALLTGQIELTFK